MSRARHSGFFHIDQPIEVLFPLFSAEGEKYWVPGWDYENVMGSTELHEDYIFLTKNHDHAANDANWLVKRYDPGAHYVEFYKVEPGEKVGIVAVKCESVSPSRTNVSVTYEYIALSERGEEFVAGFTSAEYERFVDEWRKLLEKYFARQAFES